jgi:hypothetical protein
MTKIGYEEHYIWNLVDLSWTFSIMEKNNVIWPGFTAYKLYEVWTCKRIVDFSGYKSDGR